MWADNYIKKLEKFETVEFRPRGGSMEPLINSGQLVRIYPYGLHNNPKIGDIVLCRVKSSQYLHLIKAIGENNRYLIGNNKGHTNGWTSRNRIYGWCMPLKEATNG